jgi:purine/pyrimidine-nucleoside phosphorylase
LKYDYTITSFKRGAKMDTISNVTIIKKANVYFDGKVTSRTVLFEDGTKKTLGIILPGEYEFGTNEKESMEVLAGRLNVLLSGSEKWVSYESGQTFEVPANSKFKVSADEVSDYCCSYIKE